MKFLKNSVITLFTIFLLVGAVQGVHAAEQPQVLVLYFSHTGNTRHIAQLIHEAVGGDLMELKTVDSYPQEYNRVADQAKREQRANFRPALATQINNLEQYSTIFIGYPIWWGTMPMAFFTFFEQNDLAGKTLIPFCTQEGTSYGSSVRDMKKLASGARVLKVLSIRGRSVHKEKTKEEVQQWLQTLPLGQDKGEQ